MTDLRTDAPRRFNSSDEKVLLAVILAAAAGLRILHLGRSSLWYDEIISVHTAAQALNFNLLDLAQKVHDIPLYLMFLHFWTHAFGTSEVAIRFPSVVFGVLSVYMIFRLGRTAFGSETGFLAALFMALSPFHLHFAQSARSYPLFTLLALLSLYFFIRVLEAPSRRNAAGYVVSSMLLLYVHQYAVFLLVAQNVYFLTSKPFSGPCIKLGWPRWAACQAVLAVSFLPWIVFQLGVVSRLKGEGFWIPKMDSASIYQTFLYFGGTPKLLCLFILLIFAPLLASRAETSDPGKARLRQLCAAWLTVPIFLAWAFSEWVFPIYVSRYQLPGSIAFYLLAAEGMRAVRDLTLKTGLVVLVCVLSLGGVREYFSMGDLEGPEQHAEEWKQAVRHIDKYAKPGDALLFHTFTGQWAFEYYSKRKDLSAPRSLPEPMQLYVTDEVLAALDAAAAGHSRVWLVFSHSRDKEDRLAKRLGRTHRMAGFLRFKGIQITYFVRKAAEAPR